MTPPLLPAVASGLPTRNVVHQTDALTLLRALPDGCVQLIAVDPPYNGVKDEAWDNQWRTDADYLAWLDGILREMKRVLAANGSLYLCASPRMAARVEIAVGAHFNVLTRITWQKPPYSTKAEMSDKEAMRDYFPVSEAIIFAEQYASDDRYSDREYELNGQVYKPLKEWFRERAKSEHITAYQFNKALGFATTGSGMAGSVFGEKDEFIMPTPDTYEKMQVAFPAAFNSPYIQLRREYEDLRREYEDLRRPFTVTAADPYTDVWTFPTVNTYPGKHPCEKPLAMMRHIVRASSRPGDLVLDCFCGSGATLQAAKLEGRAFIGCDMDAGWVTISKNRVREAWTPIVVRQSEPLDTLPLFREAANATA